jgi:hypothetical protein
MAWWVGITGRGQELFFLGKSIHKYFHKVKPARVPHKLLFFVRHTTVIGKTQSVLVCLGSFYEFGFKKKPVSCDYSNLSVVKNIYKIFGCCI